MSVEKRLFMRTMLEWLAERESEAKQHYVNAEDRRDQKWHAGEMHAYRCATQYINGALGSAEPKSADKEKP